MYDKLGLILIKGSETVDISNLITGVTWQGRKSSAARSIKVTLIDDDGYKHARSGIDVENGQQCIFTVNGEELFRGYVFEQSQSHKKTITITAYDNCIYLANNKDTFVYENKTATEIFKDICTRFNIPTGEIANCTYKIPELTKPKTTAYDVICDALSLDYDATGIRHYISSEGGKLSLLTRRENILQWVLETGQNIVTYTYSKSISELRTRVKMVSNEGTVIAEKSLPELEQKFGIFQEIEQPDESLSDAQINDLIASILDEKSTPSRLLNVEAIGNAEVISGLGVFIIIPHLGLSRTFYVDDDTHTWKDNKHTMSLKLSYATDLDASTSTEEETAAEHNIGDVVQFNGGYHYVSSSAGSPTGAECAPGPAKITLIAKGAKHPYHLIHTDSSTRVYGWVDSGTFS